mgnify:CR=1 FL=1
MGGRMGLRACEVVNGEYALGVAGGALLSVYRSLCAAIGEVAA